MAQIPQNLFTFHSSVKRPISDIFLSEPNVHLKIFKFPIFILISALPESIQKLFTFHSSVKRHSTKMCLSKIGNSFLIQFFKLTDSLLVNF